MPYDISWFDPEHTILRMDIHGAVSWGEWHAAIDRLIVDLAKTPNRVDFIFFDKSGLPPGNPLPHMKTTLNKLGQYPNLGLVVSVSQRSQSSLVRAFLGIVMRAFAGEVAKSRVFVNTQEEALAAIQKSRAKDAEKSAT